MTIKELCNRIHLPYDSVMNGKQYVTDEVALRSLFDKNEEEFFEEIEKLPHTYELVLYLFVKWGAEVYDEYVRLGIPDKVYDDTFSDFTIWYECCIRDYGVKGIRQYDWVYLPIKLEIFRLGRLQYQPFVMEEDVPELGLTKGMPLLEVHIPEGSSLTPDLINDSLEQSKAFFPKYFHTSYNLYHCESWLLSPQLPKIVSEDSNILKFKNNFEVYGEDFSYRQAEERVFLDVKKMMDEYPENTSLQRSLKKFLLNGGAIGMGKGVIRV